MLDSLGSQSKQFEQAFTSLSELVKGLAARKSDISNGVAYANEAARTVADLLSQARPPLQKTVHETDRVASRTPTMTTWITCLPHFPTSIGCSQGRVSTATISISTCAT